MMLGLGVAFAGAYFYAVACADLVGERDADSDRRA
jgi:hypothetical protein